MANNRNKSDSLHDLLPKHLNTRVNPNWKAIVEALGDQDTLTSDLVSEVRRQFFVKTATRPYLDRLASNSKIARPRFVGMDDPSFRQYIPILSYKPKQVKLIIDQLLDIFFFKESTTAFITSQSFEPFNLADGWEFEYLMDEQNLERIEFSAAEFTNIAAAKADEIVAAINRQAKYSYATSYYDSITKNTFIRLFADTIGSKGSIKIRGGRANIALRFNGFIDSAGNGANTQWTVTKVGEDVTFQHTAGSAPGIDKLQVGDIAIFDIVGNVGSFPIVNVSLANNQITFKNLFATAGVFTQTSASQSKFIRPNKYAAYLNLRRAMTWETAPSEIVVEMPTSPPVVKRSLKGSAHINGVFSQMLTRDSDTSMTLSDATGFPNSGSFFLEEVKEIKTHIITPEENLILSKKFNTRLISKLQRYEYTSRTALMTFGDTTLDSNQITNLGSVIGLAIGQQVSMVNIPPYAVVVDILGNTATISHPATATAVSEAVSFFGDQLTGISPNLPALAVLNEYTISSLSRTSNVVTAVTSVAHNFIVGDPVAVSGSSGILTISTTGDRSIGSNQLINIAAPAGIAQDMIIAGSGIPVGTKVLSIVGNTVTMSQNAFTNSIGGAVNFSEDLNGSFIIQSITPTSFTYNLVGSNGSASTAGSARVERPGMSTNGSKVYITDAVLSEVSRIKGPYIWDLSAPFLLSSKKGSIADSIQAGKIVRLLNLNTNDIPPEGGFIIFDYGLETQEGPVRYLYKPTDLTIAIDPSYTFQYNHSVNSAVTLIGKKGPHIMSTKGDEYPPYVTDPSDARAVLQDLIRSVKSAGIFVNFLVRYPEQLYATLDVYSSGIDPG